MDETATLVEEAPVAPRGPSLSPSRAGDFKTCPLLYRLRSIDRVPAPPSADQLRGTLVHAVLERLFDFPAAERTPERAAELVEPQWARLRDEDPEVATLFAADATPPDWAGSREWLDSAAELIAGYFAMEDPVRLEPAERETQVQAEIEGGLTLRGIIDRLDVAPDGAIRVVDYKTGGAPREAFEARALFQLKFYALVLWRTRGVVPRVLRLVYLKDREVCDYSPEPAELERFEATLRALWRAIERATERREFVARPSRLCDWCAYQALCPEFGGTPPPWPERAVGSPEAETTPTGSEVAAPA